MAEKHRTKPAKQEKMRRQGTLHAVPESRARRETLEVKSQGETPPRAGSAVTMQGSRSDRSFASRVGRQPVLESPDEHPAGKGPPMPDRAARELDALGARLKPGAAPKRAGRATVADDEE